MDEIIREMVEKSIKGEIVDLSGLTEEELNSYNRLLERRINEVAEEELANKDSLDLEQLHNDAVEALRENTRLNQMSPRTEEQRQEIKENIRSNREIIENYRNALEENNNEIEHLADDIIRENTINPTMGEQEFADQITGVTRNTEGQPTIGNSIFNDLDNTNVSMGDDTRDTILEFENEGYKPEEIMETLTPEEQRDYQQMNEERAERLADDIIRENTVNPNDSIQDVISQNTGLDREGTNIINADNSMFNDLPVNPVLEAVDNNPIWQELLGKYGNRDGGNTEISTNNDIELLGTDDNNTNNSDDSTSTGSDNQTDTNDFSVDFDNLNTIRIEDYTLDDRIEDLKNEITKLENEKKNREETPKGPYADLTDQELQNLSNELNNEIAYRMHQENGVEAHENDDLLEKIQQVQEEINARQQNNNSLSDEQLDNAIKSSKEQLQVLQDRKEENEFIKKFDLVNSERKRRQEIRNNPYNGISDVDLQNQVQQLREEYNYRVHQENGLIENDDNIVERISSIESELERRNTETQNINDNPYNNISDQELEELYNEMTEEYNFRAHHQNGMEGNFDDIQDNLDIRKAFINGERTDNLVIGEKEQGFKFENGEYVSQTELMEAIDKSFDEIGPNEVVVCKKTGKVVNVEDIKNEIIEAAKKDSQIELGENDPTLDYINHNVALNAVDNLDDKFVDKGNFEIPKDDIPEDRYIRAKVAKKVLDNYKTVSKELIPTEEKIDKLEFNARVRDMLDKFYGNRKKEKAYTKALEEYKSHIITGPDGITRVEDFEGRKQLEFFLQLEDFAYKIESLSMAEKGDLSRYIEMVEAYELIGYNFPTTLDGKKMNLEQKVNYLRQVDENYIKTYNNAYNQHLNTYENLKTLGKHGEKAPYVKIQEVKDENGKIQPKAVFANVGIGLMNAGIWGRNYIKAPIHAAVGTYIVAPVQKLLFDPETHTAGLYKNQSTHRYQARVDYFEQEYNQKVREENEKLIAEGKTPKKQGLLHAIKMTNYARLHAIMDYKHGNAMVLSAGAISIKNHMKEQIVIKERQNKLKKELDEQINNIKSQIEECNKKLDGIQTEEQKNELNSKISSLTADLKGVEEQRKLCGVPLAGLKNSQNDAVSMAQHDKANKDNVTRTVTGVKMATRVAVSTFVIPRVKKFVSENVTKYVPEETVYTSEKQISSEKMENLTFDDFRQAQTDNSVDYSAWGGNSVKAPSNSVDRGIAFEYNGKMISGTDGVGYNVFGSTPISTVQIDAIKGNDKIFDVMAETLTNAGNPTTVKDLTSYFTANPEEFTKFVENGLNIWYDYKNSGIAQGWQDGFDANQILQQITETVSVPSVIPGHAVTETITKEVINPEAIAALAALGIGTAGDLYDHVRRTNSAEEMEEAGLRRAVDGEVKEHQKESKEPYQERNPQQENEYGFVGTKKDDYATFYDESSIEQQAQQEVEGRSR